MIEKGLNLFSGNKLEILVEALSKVIERPLANVFTEETIIVQSQGMSRWISLNLAGYHGVAANIAYKFPNAFIYDVLSRLSPQKTKVSLFDTGVMTWTIMRLLTELIDDKEFITLKNYFTGNNRELKKFQLATLIADTYDQYLLFRPRMIVDWEEGKETHWQAVLWRKIVSDNDDIHRVELLKQFKKAIKNRTIEKSLFPERISVFGISSLPAFHMEIFDLLSEHIQVNLFLLNPCQQYWGDVVSEREAKKIKTKGTFAPEEDIYLEQGNSLLSSMGELGRDFFDLFNDFNHESITLFDSPGYDSLLQKVQSDIFSLTDNSDTGHVPIDDGSIEINSCHSPMREVEVLKDALYNMLENDQALEPRDILVMTPDIELFAPLVKSVFDKGSGSGSRLPYSIADRSLRNESRIVETFLALLDFVNGRFAVSDVINILETKAVRDRFEIAEKDLEIISLWINDTNIRWGIDGEHRGRLGLPVFSENSWTAGLKRMLLGYAMPGDGDTLYEGILPYNDIEGESAELLGNLCEFTDRLFLLSEKLAVSRKVGGWYSLLNQMLDNFYEKNDETQKDLQTIRDEINALSELVELSDYDDSIELSVIKHHLVKKLDSTESGHGFIAGGITFCAMLPMRSIPFKVICTIGMNSDTYPRQTTAAGFDLMARYPMRGDRSRRKDDRYLFLEVLISARKKLYISYTGQSIQDNSSIQPSVLVSELADFINDHCMPHENASPVFDSIKHPLQAFNSRYFDGSDTELYSYSDENYRAAVESFNEEREIENFISKTLPSTQNEIIEIDINDLCSFFRNPARQLLEKRFGIFLNTGFRIPEEDEPFEIDWLDRYHLTNEIAEKQIGDQNKENYYEIAKAAGVLPYGQTGKTDFQLIEKEVTAFAGEMKKIIADQVKQTVEIVIDVQGIRITGVIDGVYDNRFIKYRYAKIKGKDILDFWIKYLVLTVSKTINEGVLAGFEKTKTGGKWVGYRTGSVDSPLSYLEQLVDMYLGGMQNAAHFFPESSMTFVELIKNKGKSSDEALIKALTVWTGNQFTGRGESSDPYFDLCFKEKNPLNDLFLENSLAVFEPVFMNIEKVNQGFNR